MRHVLFHPLIRNNPSAFCAPWMRAGQHVWNPSALVDIHGLVDERRLGIAQVVVSSTGSFVCCGLLQVVVLGGMGGFGIEESLFLVQLVGLVVYIVDPGRNGTDDTVVGRQEGSDDGGGKGGGGGGGGGAGAGRKLIIVYIVEGGGERVAQKRLHRRALSTQGMDGRRRRRGRGQGEIRAE